MSPFDPGSAPGEAAAEGGEDEVIAFIQLLFPVPETEGDGSGGGIAIPLDIDHDLFVGEAHAVGGCVNDTLVGLMGDQPADIVRGEVVAFHEFGTDVGHAFDGEFENGLSFLVDIVFLGGNRLVGRWVPGAAAFHVEVGAAAAVAFEDAVENAEAFVIGFQEHAAGAVAEDDAGGSVAVVDDAAHFISADNDYLFVAAAFDIHGAAGEGIEEAGAGGGHVESPGIPSAGLVADDICRCGEEHIGGNGGDDHAVDLFGVDAPLFADLKQDGSAEVGCRFSLAF